MVRQRERDIRNSVSYIFIAVNMDSIGEVILKSQENQS
jgi:hypothetical protein